MDLTRAVGYRGFALNTVQFDAATRDMVGCEITSVEYGRVVGVGYDEKRALSDGRDAFDVFLDQRMVNLAGNVYGRTRAEAFDIFADFTEAMVPTDAYAEDPSNKGFLPLDFWRPTLAVTDFPDGLIHQMLLARPLATPGSRFDSDRHGGPDTGALAIPWTAQMHCRDPRIVNLNFTTTTIGRTAVQGSGSVRNRGTRPAVIEVYLVIPDNVNHGDPGFIELEIGGSFRVRFTLPHSTASKVLRYNSDAKVVEYDGDLRMDLISFKSGTPHKNLLPGLHGYSWVRSAGRMLSAGSYFRFRDTWA